MDRKLLHRPALEAVLHLATSDRRWTSRSQLATECGFTASTLSNALSGERGLSDTALTSLCDVLAIPTGALVLPALARPGDLETVRLIAELKGLREDVLRRTDDIARAINTRNGG